VIDATGTIVNVSTEPQLQNAVAHLQSNTTIPIASGTYALTSTLYINGTFTNVALRGSTGSQRPDRRTLKATSRDSRLRLAHP